MHHNMEGMSHQRCQQILNQYTTLLTNSGHLPAVFSTWFTAVQ